MIMRGLPMKKLVSLFLGALLAVSLVQRPAQAVDNMHWSLAASMGVAAVLGTKHLIFDTRKETEEAHGNFYDLMTPYAAAYSIKLATYAAGVTSIPLGMYFGAATIGYVGAPALIYAANVVTPAICK